jgi:hypothetical protein
MIQKVLYFFFRELRKIVFLLCENEFLDQVGQNLDCKS